MIVYKHKLWEKNNLTQVMARFFKGKKHTYEHMIDKTTKEAINELVGEFPHIKNMRLQVSEFSDSNILVTVYGEITDPWKGIEKNL